MRWKRQDRKLCEERTTEPCMDEDLHRMSLASVLSAGNLAPTFLESGPCRNSILEAEYNQNIKMEMAAWGGTPELIQRNRTLLTLNCTLTCFDN